MIRVADEIWVGAALLHIEQPGRKDFSVAEIVERSLRERLGTGFRPGLPLHASKHCVATKSPNPARLRMLSETERGRRRLYRPGDRYHPDRSGGRVRPDKGDLPATYQYLVDWYENDYVKGVGGGAARPRSGQPLPKGGTAEQLQRLAGTIPPDELKLMEQAIQDCERIDWSEW